MEFDSFDGSFAPVSEQLFRNIIIDDALNLFYVHSTFVIFKHTIVDLY